MRLDLAIAPAQYGFKQRRRSSYAFSSSFTTLVSVRFSSSGSDSPQFNGFSVDNINATAATAVPEVQTYAMLLAGLGMIGFVARRRRKT